MDQILSETATSSFSMGFIVLAGLFSLWLVFQNQKRHLACTRRCASASSSPRGFLPRAAGRRRRPRDPQSPNAISMASQRLQRESLPARRTRGRSLRRLTGSSGTRSRRLNVIIEDFLNFLLKPRV
ncbi:MAG: hypothetical protein IPI61_10095 [Syntrophaceae bacterium]|nr:hypothetical protein [Syntrophaceae bacterium]